MDDTMKPGATVAFIPCPACGSHTAVKLTKALKAYFICDGATPEGKACNSRMFFGPARSAEFKRDYIEARRGANSKPDNTAKGQDDGNTGLDTGRNAAGRAQERGTGVIADDGAESAPPAPSGAPSARGHVWDNLGG